MYPQPYNDETVQLTAAIRCMQETNDVTSLP